MAHMNGFADRGLDENAFSEKAGLTSGLRTFDAFPKTKPTYTAASRRGGQWTVLVFAACFLLTISEFFGWWRGKEVHHFSVERGVSHELQLNLDIVVAMRCDDLHVNVQDAAGDRIMAGDLLTKHDTNWQLWNDKLNKRQRRGGHAYQELHADNSDRREAEEQDSHVGHVLGHMREGGKKFVSTPRLRRGQEPDSCRIFGSLEGNKVQGDFHITARGHGYFQFGEHLDHSKFNFSHLITELSFGPHYPSLLNPLDKTTSTTSDNFFKYQYYLSIVPTIFTRSGSPNPATLPPPPTLDSSSRAPTSDRNTIFTNQYAATSQSHGVDHRTIPGVFFKYDIEPILLIVAEERGSFLRLLVRLVNVISGVLVGGGWMYQLSEWASEVWGKRRRTGTGLDRGMLHGRHATVEDDDDD